MDDMGHLVMPGAYFRSRASVYLKDRQGQLRPCEQLSVDQIFEAAVPGHSTCTSNLKVPKRPRTSIDDADSKRTNHGNTETGEEEEITIEFPWDSKGLTSIVAQSRNRMLLGRQVLVMALDRRRRLPSLRKILAMKVLAECTIRENPYLRPGHTPYDNFFESLLEFFKLENGDAETPNLPLFGQFLESSAEEAEDEIFNTVERGGIRTVFHGTNHDVMDAILKSGLDPARRGKDPGNPNKRLHKDYFGVDYMTSLPYTEIRTRPVPTLPKLLVFIVINPAKSSRGANIVTVKFNKFQLPIAEIELEG